MTKEIFKHILDNDEKIIWSGKPTFLPFILTWVGFLLVWIIRGFIDYWFIKKDGFSFFILLHSAPLWLSIWNMIRLWFVFPNTIYAYTNKRVLIRWWFRWIDYKSIDFDKIQNIEVNVNPIENYLKVWTIKIFSWETTNKWDSITNDMIWINNPYDVFKNLKKTSVDIKTDFNYPNDLRPKTNKWYKTEYKGNLDNPEDKK